VLDEKMKDEVKITVIATGFKHVDRKERGASMAATVIQPTRTASSYSAPAERARPMDFDSPSPSPRPTPAPAPVAVPSVKPMPREDISVSDISNVKTSFGDDDLDVPAFLRKRQES
jgi:cell division protein FtsZ